MTQELSAIDGVENLKDFINKKQKEGVIGKRGSGKSLANFAVGLGMYGDNFNGFQELSEIRDLIPDFKNFYFEKKILNEYYTAGDIIKEFNSRLSEGKKFHPKVYQLNKWRKKWDLEIVAKKMGTNIIDGVGKNVHQVINTRDAEDNYLLNPPSEKDLERGVQTLGGELLNDAMQMLRDDQDAEDLYDDETLIKRRNYIINVFSHTTKLMLGKAALALKASAEKRENAGFLMNLIAKATAGGISEEEMSVLEHAYAPKDASDK